ncbi:MAG: hypothetical protein VB135_00280 [Burkholderia sp.]
MNQSAPIRWPDLSAFGAELIVEDLGASRQLTIKVSGARRLREAVRALGFRGDGPGRYVRSKLSISLSELRSAFPGASESLVARETVLHSRDPLQELKTSMQRQMRDAVSVEHLHEASPDAATQIRANAFKELLGIRPVFFRNVGDDPRLSFEAVDLRRAGDDRIYVNVDAALPITAVLGHEALHRMRQQAPDLYDDLVVALRPMIDQPAFAKHATRLRAISRSQDSVLIGDDALREEAVADIVGDMLMREEVWRSLDDRALLTRLIEFLREFLAQLLDAIRGRPDGCQTATGGAELVNDLEAAREAVADALVAWRDGLRTQDETASALTLAFRQANGPEAVTAAPEFAGSKIRRPDGTLLPVFRGEWGPLAESPFLATHLPSVPYSSSPDIASVYALTSPRNFDPLNTPRVSAAFLNLTNPLQLGHPFEDVVEVGSLVELMTAGGAVTADEVKAAFARTDGYIRHLPAGGNPELDDWEDFSGDPAELQSWDYAYNHDVADNPAFVELAKRAGFDGFTFTGLFTSSDQFTRPLELAAADGYDHGLAQAPEYRAFYPEQVKSIYHADFSANLAPDAAPAFRRRVGNGQPFYSELLQVVEHGKGMPRSAPAAKWLGWLNGSQRRGEYRAAERAWMGVDDWLEQHQGEISRDQLCDYVRANVVPLEEVILGEMPKVSALCSELGWTVRLANGEIEVVDEDGNQVDLELAPEALKIALEEELRQGGGATLYDGYQLPGVNRDPATYREILLCLPAADDTAMRVAEKAYQEAEARLNVAREQRQGKVDLSPLYAAASQAYAELRRQREELGKITFEADHFRKEHNTIIAHVRFADRVTPDGDRILLVEEVQSDLHQQGRAAGYRDRDALRQLAALELQIREHEAEMLRVSELIDPATNRVPEGTGFGELLRLRNEAIARAAALEEGRVPDAPFKRSEEWALLAIKRVARWAAESPVRYEHIAWTTGDLQVRRYSNDLRQSVDKIDWVTQGQVKLVNAFQAGMKSFSCQLDAGGTVTQCSHEDGVGLSVEKLFGKDVAARIDADSSGKLSHDGLYVGGHGMRTFYDKIVPGAIARWAKRFDSVVSQTRVATGDADDESLELLLPDELDRLDEFASFRSVERHSFKSMPGDVSVCLTKEQAMEQLKAGRNVWAEGLAPSVAVHCVQITDAMRASVLQGMPMFKRSGDNSLHRSLSSSLLCDQSPPPVHGEMDLEVAVEGEQVALKF